MKKVNSVCNIDFFPLCNIYRLMNTGVFFSSFSLPLFVTFFVFGECVHEPGSCKGTHVLMCTRLLCIFTCSFDWYAVSLPKTCNGVYF